MKRTGQDRNTPVQRGLCVIVECRTDVTFWGVDCDHLFLTRGYAKRRKELLFGIRAVRHFGVDTFLISRPRTRPLGIKTTLVLDRSFRRRFLWSKFTPVPRAPNFHCGGSLKL